MIIPGGTKWGGLNKRLDPTELSPEQSPDLSNVYYKDQTLGLLAPRPGKAYAGASSYNIWGVMPYDISGQLGHLVAYGDSTSTEVNLLNLYSFTTPHSGWGDAARNAPNPPAVGNITRNLGFNYNWNGPSAVQTEIHACNKAINGATRCVATMASVEWETAGTLKVYLQFDGGAWTLANTMTAEATSGCCGSLLTVDEVPVLINCSAFTTLTGIKVESSDADGTENLSGQVQVVGSAG